MTSSASAPVETYFASKPFFLRAVHALIPRASLCHLCTAVILHLRRSILLLRWVSRPICFSLAVLSCECPRCWSLRIE